jgi:hypothetical protein
VKLTLSPKESRLFDIADAIAAKHAKGFFQTTYIVNKIRLRTDIWNVLCSEAGRRTLSDPEGKER